jgi:hypothetical protein
MVNTPPKIAKTTFSKIPKYAVKLRISDFNNFFSNNINNSNIIEKQTHRLLNHFYVKHNKWTTTKGKLLDYQTNLKATSEKHMSMKTLMPRSLNSVMAVAYKMLLENESLLISPDHNP